MGLFTNKDKDKDREPSQPDGGVEVAARKKKSSVAHKIGMIALIAFIIYAAVLVISTEAELNEQKAVLEDLKSQITEAQQENDEYERILGTDDESEYMEMIAIEKMGYAYPNEKRFYIKESN